MSNDCNNLNCNVFAGTANTGCYVFNRNAFQAEQNIYNTAYKDLINNFGVNVDYYVNQYNTDTADNIYGEHPTKPFAPAQTLRMYVELSNNSITLQKFGFVNDDEFTGFIHIDTFTSIFTPLSYHVANNQRIEPKSGDVVVITDIGYCRPGLRGPRYYEITERVDQDIPSINPMLGTYIYRVKGKRLEYSFEPNLSGESGNSQVFDNTFRGILSSQLQPTSLAKTYDMGDAISNEDGSTLGLEDGSQLLIDPVNTTSGVDKESKRSVFDQTINNTDVYGGYGY